MKQKLSKQEYKKQYFSNKLHHKKFYFSFENLQELNTEFQKFTDFCHQLTSYNYYPIFSPHSFSIKLLNKKMPFHVLLLQFH